jgi:hypothetical protein
VISERTNKIVLVFTCMADENIPLHGGVSGLLSLCIVMLFYPPGQVRCLLRAAFSTLVGSGQSQARVAPVSGSGGR